MDLVAIGNRILMYPDVEEVRRKDEFYITTSCGVEVPAPWGGKRIHGACHRKEWYRNKGYTPTNPPDWQGIRKMYWGNAIAAAEIELYKKAGIWIDSEVSFWVPEYYLKGRIDCFVRMDDGSRAAMGTELKTTWSYGSKGTIECKVGTKPWPKWDHIIQCALYHWHYRRFANHWQLVYMARDSGNARSHTVLTMEDNRISVNGEIVGFTIDHILERLHKLGVQLQGAEPPGRDFELVWDRDVLAAMANAGELGKTDTDKVRKGHKVLKGDWQCAYCEYGKLCWQNVPLPFDADMDKMLR